MKLLFSFLIYIITNISLETIQSNIISDTNLQNYSIVFVHIGPNLPNYLETAIVQTRLFNKNADIYLIANEKALKEISSKILQNNLKLIACESLTKTKEHEIFQRTYRSSYIWKPAIERFFYLNELITEKNLFNIFHLENDVMIYIDLEKYLPIFEKNYPQMIAATFDSDQRCIAGFIYIADRIPLAALCSYFAQEAKKSLFDMETISNFKDIYYKIYIDHLPILCDSFINENELRNLLGKTTKNKYVYCNNFEKFNSIFDAAAIGQYLGGIHSNPSKIGFINERCLFSLSKFTFEWQKDDQNRLIPYIIYKNEKYPINNLHIHSKNLKAFYSLR